MAFNPESTDARQRRAFAHAKLHQLRHGSANYQETAGAVNAASNTKKGKGSGFANSLGKTAVVLVDWGMTSFKRPGIIHHNFGGYVMPIAETRRWTWLQSVIDDIYAEMSQAERDGDAPHDPALSGYFQKYSQVRTSGYEQASFSRIYQGGPEDVPIMPAVGTVVNPVVYDDIGPFVGWNNTEAVDLRIAKLL